MQHLEGPNCTVEERELPFAARRSDALSPQSAGTLGDGELAAPTLPLQCCNSALEWTALETKR